MATTQLSADSTTLILNGRAFNDFVDGDTIEITPVNPLTSHTRSSKSLNVQKRSDGKVYDVKFRLPKYSDDDNYMSAAIAAEVPTIFNGSCKENYLYNGAARVTSFTLNNGSITDLPTDKRNNTDGDNLMEYTIRFNEGLRL